MAAFAPRSSAALAADLELRAAAEAALHAEGYYAPKVIRAERVADGLVEALATIEQTGGRRAARLALIRTDAGKPVVEVLTGWPVRM